MKSYILLKDNLFDSLYQMILNIDNDRCNVYLDKMTRYTFITIFIKCIENVKEFDKQSLFYNDYKNQNSIESFYRTIIRPNLKCSNYDMNYDMMMLVDHPSKYKSYKMLFDEFNQDEKAEHLEKLQYKKFDQIYMISNDYDVIKL